MIPDIRQAIEGLDKFDKLELIDEGGNAYSFSAVHKHLNEKRFLKVIEVPAGADDSILQEPRTLIAALEAKPISNNIVKIHDAEFIQANGNRFVLLQMEYLNGTSLQKLLEKRTFGQQEAIRLTLDILHGVGHLHRQRLVHRDLKPGNILLHNGIPKIADFGSVAKVSDNNDFVNASKHSDLYVPPEGWAVPRKYTFSSDLYQIAMVLYQLVNGGLPLNGQHYLTPSVLRKIKKSGKTYETLDRFDAGKAEQESFAELTAKEKLLLHALLPRPYYSKEIDRIIRKAVRADLNDRFKSVEDFINKLSKVSVPDWKPTVDGFEAKGWKNKDWKIRQVKKRKGVEFNVEKRAAGLQNYRCCFKAPDLEEAFAFVDKQ